MMDTVVDVCQPTLNALLLWAGAQPQGIKQAKAAWAECGIWLGWSLGDCIR